MKKILDKFFLWYNKYYLLNLSIAFALFALQIVHLYWLGTSVIAEKLTSHSFFQVNNFWLGLLLIVDYTEIPALFSTGLIYVNEIRKNGSSFKNMLFIVLLLSQFLHIFWITDEFVIEHFTKISHQTIFSGFLAWIAILIDYGEVPVIIDTTKKLIAALKKGKLKAVKQVLDEK